MTEKVPESCPDLVTTNLRFPKTAGFSSKFDFGAVIRRSYPIANAFETPISLGVLPR